MKNAFFEGLKLENVPVLKFDDQGAADGWGGHLPGR